MKNRRTNLLLSIITIAAASAILLFNIPAKAETGRTVQYEYSADKTNFGKKTGITVLDGNAKFIRGDGDYLYAEMITIYRDPKTNELVKIESVGNVDMKEKDMTAKCNHSIFYEQEERIELKGAAGAPAVVNDGKNMMEAPFIIYYRADERIVASGLLFSVGLEAQGELDNGTISEELKQEFTNNKIPLSDSVTASAEEANVSWLIVDGDKTYIVKKEADKLNIYVKGSVKGHVTVEVKESESAEDKAE